MMDLVHKVEHHLKSLDFQAAAYEILDPTNLPSIHAEGMDLIGKLCDLGLQEASNPEDIATCSQLLNYISHNYNPKLALVSVLEQAESFMHSPKFSLILKAIQIVYSHHKSKKAATFSWTLDLFNKHLREFLLFPEELNNKLIGEKERLVLESQPQIMLILQFYKDVIEFYEPVIKELILKRKKNEKNDKEKAEIKKQEKIVKCCLIDLLGKPLIYFDLTEKKSEKEESRYIKSEARIISEKLLSFISQVNLDSSFLVKWTEKKCSAPPPRSSIVDYDPDEEAEADEIQMSLCAVANYFYLTQSEKIEPIVSTYSNDHLFRVLIPLVNALLSDDFENYSAYTKALSLAQKIIEDTTTPLGSEFIWGGAYAEFVQKLAQLIVYCESREVRIQALTVLKTYFWKFDPEGQFMFIQFMLVKVSHSGLLGYMVTQLKDCVKLALDSPSNAPIRLWFLGENLTKILFQICVLREGASTDLMLHNDTIVATLNLLRYLGIRDGTKNDSGVMGDMKKIDLLMLKPLRSAIDLSKAHYKLKGKEIESKKGEKKKVEKENNNEEIETTVQVGGKEVKLDQDLMSEDEKLKVINSALLNLDIMESLLVRVNEFLNKHL